MDSMDYIELRDGELAELIRFSAESGEPIAGTIPANRIIVSQTGPKTMKKLAKMRGINTEDCN